MKSLYIIPEKGKEVLERYIEEYIRNKRKTIDKEAIEKIVVDREIKDYKKEEKDKEGKKEPYIRGQFEIRIKMKKEYIEENEKNYKNFLKNIFSEKIKKEEKYKHKLEEVINGDKEIKGEIVGEENKINFCVIAVNESGNDIISVKEGKELTGKIVLNVYMKTEIQSYYYVETVEGRNFYEDREE